MGDGLIHGQGIFVRVRGRGSWRRRTCSLVAQDVDAQDGDRGCRRAKHVEGIQKKVKEVKKTALYTVRSDHH